MPSLSLSLSLCISADAYAQAAACTANDAPALFAGAACNGVCAMVGNVWECDVGAFCGADHVEAWAVSNYDGTGLDYSAWGTCVNAAATFCCAHSEQIPPDQVDEVHLIGGSHVDRLWLTHVPTGSVLKPAHAHDLLGYAYGRENTLTLNELFPVEEIHGSDFVGSSYRDNLYGEGGDDFVYGRADSDIIYGGDGNDELYGESGDDRIDGGLGNDYLDGADGRDTLCDAEKYVGASACASNGGNEMQGGNDNDALWYEDDPGCGLSDLSGLSDAGAGAGDHCGDAAVWPGLWTNCEVAEFGKPMTCPL